MPFNASEDPLNLIVRTREIFAAPPFAGALSSLDTWNRVEQHAFGSPFASHFETRVLPLLAESLQWGKSEAALPVIVPETWVRNLDRTVGERISNWIFEQARTREQLTAIIRERMRPDGVVPHAPTALLRHPIVRLSEDRVAVASAWRVRTHLKTGIWATFMQATKDVLGNKAAQEWTVAFGYRFEDWLRRVATSAATSPAFRGKLILPKHPGSDDEIEDVVVYENGTAIVFSAKARLVEESVARHAKSRSMVIDWYSKFFFAPASGRFRDGVVRQLSSRVDLIRQGAFEPTLPRQCHVIPVLVTYDSLCEEFLLYRWLEDQCKAQNLLRQQRVSPIVLAHIDDYERLMARASRGTSLTEFLRSRDTLWQARRLQLQLGATRPDDRLPQANQRFREIMAAMSAQLFRASRASPAEPAPVVP